MDYEITADPLFMGLTRPAMLFGVTYPFVILNGFGCLSYFIVSSNFLAFLLLPVLHGVGYLICSKEPLAVELFMTKFSKCNKCPNKSFHGNVNSYDPF